jgi:hypothetical protein
MPRIGLDQVSAILLSSSKVTGLSSPVVVPFDPLFKVSLGIVRCPFCFISVSTPPIRRSARMRDVLQVGQIF